MPDRPELSIRTRERTPILLLTPCAIAVLLPKYVPGNLANIAVCVRAFVGHTEHYGPPTLPNSWIISRRERNVPNAG